MQVEDPRERHDDLETWRVEENVDSAEFARRRETEAVRSGWVAVGLVFDDADRVVFAYHEDEERWMAPGGVVQPGETLAEGLVREVREETGVGARPERPRAATDVVMRDGEATASFTVVFFEATATSAAVGDDLGVGDEAIAEADWFAELPEPLYNREEVAGALERCERRVR